MLSMEKIATKPLNGAETISIVKSSISQFLKKGASAVSYSYLPPTSEL